MAMTIGRKLALGYALFTLVLFLMGIVMLTRLEENQRESINTTSVTLASSVANTITKVFQHRMEMITSVAYHHRDVLEVSATAGYDRQLSRELYQDLVLRPEIERGYRVFDAISLLDMNGNVIADSSNRTKGKNFSDAIWWEKVKKDGLYISEVKYETHTNYYSITVVHIIEDKSRKQLGMIKAEVSILPMIEESRLQHHQLHMGSVIEVVCVKHQRIVYSTRPFSPKQVIPDWYKEHIIGEKGGFEREKLDRKYHYAHIGIPFDKEGPKWFLVLSNSLDELDAPVADVRRVMLWGALLILMVGIAIVLFTMFRIVRPLRELHNGVDIIGGGNLGYKVGTNARDEIGQLSRAFDAMTENLLKTTVSRDALQKEVKERIAAEESVHRLKEQLQTILDNVNEGIIGINRDGVQTFVNPAALALLGYEHKGEMLGKNAHSLWHFQYPDGRPFPESECPVREIAENGMMINLERDIFWKKDGTPLPVHYTAAPMLRAGKVEGAVLAFADISKQIEAEEYRNVMMEKLRQSNADLQQFAYIASHDLQEPLRMVTSYLQLVENRYKEQLGDDGKEFIDFAVDGAERMQKLINGLLEFSRVNTRGGNFTDTDMNAVIQDVMSNLKFAIEDSGATVNTDNLPSIVADANQMAQLFGNLIGNALKFHGETAPVIRISYTEEEKGWHFSVEDNGIGIKPDYFEKIFLIFQRLHKRGEYEGTGIGLAVCKRIMERHNGEIWVESEEGQGTTFHLIIPKSLKIIEGEQHE